MFYSCGNYVHVYIKHILSLLKGKHCDAPYALVVLFRTVVTLDHLPGSHHKTANTAKSYLTHPDSHTHSYSVSVK